MQIQTDHSYPGNGGGTGMKVGFNVFFFFQNKDAVNTIFNRVLRKRGQHSWFIVLLNCVCYIKCILSLMEH